MHLDSYEIFFGDTSASFGFISEGRRGKFKKTIQFQKMALPQFYNLAFGDENPKTKEMDDKVVTNNGDTEKILATVAAAIYIFTDKHPGVWIYAEGSTKARTRLYAMGINKYFDVLENDFEIAGEFEEQWIPYKKGINYGAFAARRKKQ